MNTQPIADTMNKASIKLLSLLSPEALIAQNKTKLSDMCREMHEMHVEAIYKLAQESEGEFITYNDDQEPIQVFERTIGHNLTEEYTTSYEFTHLDDCGNWTRSNRNEDGEDSDTTIFYMGENVDESVWKD